MFSGHRLVLTLLVLSSSALSAQPSAVLLERLRLTAVIASLDTPSSQPFHLKATVQIEPQYQRSPETGTVELWYAATNLQRITYDFPSYKATFLETPTARFHTTTTATPPYLVRAILDLLLHPLPQSFSDEKATLQKHDFGKLSLDCITVAPPEKKNLQPSTYCLSQANSDLRITFAPSGQNSVNEALGSFRDRRPSLQLLLTFSGKPAARLRVTLLQGQATPYPQTSDTTGLTSDPIATIVPSGIVAGKVIRKEPPIYPDDAKSKHISGAVLLHAIIGTDGHIKDLQVIGSPDDSLSKSAVEAVNKWTYQPFLLNGTPTEVDTTITVHYNFSPV